MLSNGIHIGRRGGVRLTGGGGGGGGVTYWLHDNFTTNEIAPLTSPRTAEPGPGTLTITDTENKLSISAGALVIGGGKTSLTFGDPGVWAGAITRATGRTLVASLVRSSGGIAQFGFDTNQSGTIFPSDSGWRIDFGNLQTTNTNSTLETNVSTAVEFLAVCLLSTGCLLMCRLSGVWRLSYRIATGATATLYPAIINFSMVGTAGMIRGTDLAAPFNTDYGLATQQLAGARTAGDTFTHTADCLVEWTQTTRPSADQTEMRFRIQDANNYWQVTVDSSGNLDLDEVVAGTPTQRGTSAGVIVNGDRIVVIANGSTIRVYEADTLRITYNSASNFTTATAGELEVLGTGGAISDIVAWPRTLTGTAATALDATVA